MSTLHTGIARLLFQCLAQAGVDVMSVYGRDDIASLARLSGQSRMPIEVWDDMMARAQQELGDIDVALKLTDFMGPLDSGAVGFIAMASRNVKEAAETFAQFYPLLSDAYVLEVAMVGDQLTTRMQPLTSHRSQHLERFTLGAICRHSRWLTRRPDMRFDAHLAFSPPAGRRIHQYVETFGGALCFDADESVLYRPAGAERLDVSRGGKEVKALLASKLSKDLAALCITRSNLLADVEQVVAEKLAVGDVRIEHIAQDLGMSVRTLQVRMKDMDLGFRAVLDKVRHEQALGLLEAGEMALVDIAARLGFASQSSFARAFARWTRVTPGVYRRQHARPRNARKEP